MTLWAALWRSENRLDGPREHILCEDCLPRLFTTQAGCRAYIKERYGYLSKRHDLRREPHGWKTPVPVRVKVERI